MLQFKALTLLVLILSIDYCINCWVINNIDVPESKKQLKSQLHDGLSNEEFAPFRITWTYPGTKWCGVGSKAEDYEDLGKERETDICCREHDLCPDFFLAGETKHNLTNEAIYVRMSCECDEQFRMCLRKADSSAARNIGLLYFNLLETKCFRFDYPVLKCTRRGGWLNIKCLEHTYDTRANKIYQWFDVRKY